MTDTTDLRPGPALLYPLKAGLTHARSALWLTRGDREAAARGIRILFYHRVSDDRDELAVTPRRFREQMGFLAAEGYRAVDVATAVGLLADPPPRTICLSFDDGYLDVAEHALPVLEEHGFSATVFLATGVTGGSAAFSWYRAQPPLMSWEDVARLDGGALRFEAHTVTHPNLLALGDEEARGEISGSKRELEERLGRPVEIFCYPAGLYRPRDRALVAEAGFRTACTCEPGLNTAATDPLQLRRIQIDARDRLLDFRAKAGGGHDRLSRAGALWRHRRYGVSSRS